MTNSLADRILEKVRSKGRGAVFASKDYLDLGNRAAVDQALSRLTRGGYIRRLSRGLYDYPEIHPRLGSLSPAPDAVAGALAKKTNSTLQVSGAHAANKLGLTTQVPARVVYLTNSSSKRVKVGNRTFDLRHTTPKNMAAAGRASGTVIQALRYIGRDSVDAGVIKKLRDTLSDDDKASLKKDVRYAPDWMRPVVAEITG